ncbi:MAG: T9SS type A sorting domain-containing protein [candidate division Zixibacteria bacterium]
MKTRLSLGILYTFAFWVLILSGVAQSDIILVPAQRTTIQIGINAASEGDTVLVAPGIYSGPGNSRLDFLGKRILVTSEGGSELTTILTTGESRSVTFDSGEDSLSILDGFTVSGGYEINFDWSQPFRGGILCIDTSPLIRNCIIRDCYAEEGGGLFLSGGAPRIENCLIENNKASHRGGAIMALCERLTIVNSTITKNRVKTTEQGRLASGGGIKNLGNLFLKNCNISGNRVTHDSGLPSMDDFALAQGGGIYSLLGRVEIDSCIIARNSAGTGAGLVCGLADATISFTKIFNNTSSVYAGIAFISGFQNPLDVRNSTFACNYSARDLCDGIAILSSPSFVKAEKTTEKNFELGNYSAGGIVKNNLFAFNSSTPVYNDDAAYTLDISFNNIWHTVSGPDYGGVFTDLTGIDGNISYDPMFCSVSDSGLDIDAYSPCADGGELGEAIGAGQVLCDLYAAGPQRISVKLNEDTPAGNQAILDNTLNQLRPWDSLHIASDNSTVLIENLSIDFPIYVFGGGKYRDSSFVLSKDFSLQNRPTVTISDFAILRNVWIDGYHGDGLLLGYNAINFSNSPTIIDSSYLTAFESDAALAIFEASPLIRNCEITNGISAIGNGDVIASNNFWECPDIICIDSLLQYDSLFYTGTIFVEPFLTQSPTSAEDLVNNNLPHKIVLSQNYPNPFNASTKIEFTIHRAGHVELFIFDILGRRVANIIYKHLPAGSHQVIWSGKNDSGNDSPSGIYIYRLKLNNQTEIKKLILLK